MLRCETCIKKDYCFTRSDPMNANLTGCSDWVGLAVEEPIKVFTNTGDTIPDRPYPNIYELEDRICILEARIQDLENKEKERS